MDDRDVTDIVHAVRRYVRDVVVPAEEFIEDNDNVPSTIRSAARDMGLFGFAIPEEHGGMGLSMWQESQLVFELGYTTPAFRSMFGTNNGIAGHVLIEGGTDQQRKNWLPQLADGSVVASFGLTEPDAGSDPSSLRTAAVRDGDAWLLTGTKRYITNAPLADVIFVFARVSGGAGDGKIATFIVDSRSPGLSVGAKDQKMGQNGAWSADVILDGTPVPAECLVGGEEGISQGFATAMRCLVRGRIHIAAMCVGMMQRLVDEMVAWAQQRVQGSHVIASYQLIQAMVADSVTELHAARALVLATARAYDDGSDRTVGPSAAKLFCSEAVGRVADRAVQVHGGAGYMHGVAVERMYRDARLFRVYEGTSQIQQLIIARAVLGSAARS